MARGRRDRALLARRDAPLNRTSGSCRIHGLGNGRVSVGYRDFQIDAAGAVLYPDVPAHELLGPDGGIGAACGVMVVRLDDGQLTDTDGVAPIPPGLYALSEHEIVAIADTSQLADLAGDDLVMALRDRIPEGQIRVMQETLWKTSEGYSPDALTIAFALTGYHDSGLEDARADIGSALQGALIREVPWDSGGYRISDYGYFLLDLR